MPLKVFHCRTKSIWGVTKSAFVNAESPIEAAYTWAEKGLGPCNEIDVYEYTKRGRGVIYELDDPSYRVVTLPSNAASLYELLRQQR